MKIQNNWVILSWHNSLEFLSLLLQKSQMLQTVICKLHCCIWLFLSRALSLSLSHSISFGELFGSLLLACLVRMVTELFGVWFPRSICRFHELGPGSIEAPVTCLAGGGGGGGHNEGWTQGNGGSAGEQRGAAPEPFLLRGQGVTEVEVVGGWRGKSDTERVRGKKEEEEGADRSMAPGGLV